MMSRVGSRVWSRTWHLVVVTSTVLLLFGPPGPSRRPSPIGGLTGVKANPDAKRLYDDLLSNYNRLIRPVGNHSEKVTVRLGLKLTQLIDLNLKNQILTTNVWVEQIWNDYKLTWDPEEYGGVTLLYVPSELLWLPDIVLYNNADGHYVVTTMTKAIVYYNGTVVWKPPAIFKSSCEIDVQYFPFDQQNCFMKFGSWTYDGNLIDLKHVQGIEEENKVEVGMDLHEFYPSVEWDVMAVPAIRNVKIYACCEEPYPDIIFYINLRRKTLFYTVNMIIPTVGISYLSVLVFYLPADSGEKVTLAISILLSLVMFFMLITEIMPSTSLSLPLLGKYLLFTMALVGLSVLITIMVLNLHYRQPSTHKMAPWVKKVFIRILPRLLLMKRPETARDFDLCPPNLIPPPPPPPVPPPPPPPPPSSLLRARSQNGLEPGTSGGAVGGIGFSPAHASQNLLSPHAIGFQYGGISGGVSSIATIWNRPHLDSESDPCGVGHHHLTRKYPMEIERSIVNLKFIAQHMANLDEFNTISQDWKYVAMVMDRLFLYLFAIAVIGGTIGIIMQAPALYDDRHPMDTKLTKIETIFTIADI